MRPIKRVSWIAAAASHRGPSHKLNEDCVAIDYHILSDDRSGNDIFYLNEHQHTLMVADGIGGHPYGHIASRSALTFLTEHGIVTASSPEECAQRLRDADSFLYDLMEQDPRYLTMGTTIAGLTIDRHFLLLFNIGDSRCYLHRSGELLQASVDDVPIFSIRASKYRHNNGITHALGGCISPTRLEPHTARLPPLTANETILICSDGLTGVIEDDEICQQLDASDDVNLIIRRLLTLVHISGGRDDTSIVLVRRSDYRPSAADEEF